MVKKAKKETNTSLQKNSQRVSVEQPRKIKIKVIGIGGGGNSIVSEMASKISRASFVAANTDGQALKTINHRVVPFQFGKELTEGLGTGMNVEIGETAARNAKDKIKKLMENQDLVILVSCLGGGTGSGATPLFAKISKEVGNLTIGIFTLPFNFEGEKKLETAKESLEKLKSKLNAIVVIPNERIFQIIDKTAPLKEALSSINRNLTETLRYLIETISQAGVINVDFADLKTILDGRGRLAYLSIADIEDKPQEAIEKMLNNPLYPYTIKGARGILLNIIGERLGIEDVSQISRTISGLAAKEAKIIFGMAHHYQLDNKKKSSKSKIVLLATGCSPKFFSIKTKGSVKTKSKSKRKSQKTKIFVKKEKNLFDAKKKNKLPKKSFGTKSQKKTEQHQKENKIKEVKKQKHWKKKNLDEEKIRKNALEVKKEIEREEKELEAKEKIWETPAFLRKGIKF